MCFKSVIPSGRSLFLSKIKNTSLKLPVCVSPLQLVNLHRNRRYFLIKLHTWFCLSYFLKTNITFYCIYQYFMSIKSFFNTVSVSRYSATSTRKFTKKSEIFLHKTSHVVLSIIFLEDQHNPAGTPGYTNGTESFFGLKGRPSVVRDVKIHNQPVLRMRRK